MPVMPDKSFEPANALMLGIRMLMQLTMLVGFFWALSQGRLGLAGLVVLIMLATLSPIWLSHWLEIHLPPEAELLAILFLYSSLFLGEFGDFYEKFFWWDALLHTSSGFLMGLFAYILIFVLNRSPRSSLNLTPPFVALFTMSFAIAAGGVWEIFEYSCDYFFGLNMQKSGLEDTMGDMIVNLIGASVFGLIGYLQFRLDKDSLIAPMIDRFMRDNPDLLK
jgi:hypothetical protein